jgi:hypothetical protein
MKIQSYDARGLSFKNVKKYGHDYKITIYILVEIKNKINFKCILSSIQCL